MYYLPNYICMHVKVFYRHETQVCFRCHVIGNNVALRLNLHIYFFHTVDWAVKNNLTFRNRTISNADKRYF